MVPVCLQVSAASCLSIEEEQQLILATSNKIPLRKQRDITHQLEAGEKLLPGYQIRIPKT